MTEVFKKLNFKGQDPILVVAAPRAFETDLESMAAETCVHPAPKAERPQSGLLLGNAEAAEAAAGPADRD